METNKLPSRNIAITDIRCVTVACSPQTTCTGRAKMAISVRIFGTAFPINEPLRLMQVPGRLKFQALAIGLHWNTLTQIIAMTHPMTMLPRIIAAIRKLLVGNMRAYMSRMEILTIPIVVQYTHSKVINSWQLSVCGDE